tara:strand:- start:50323 stop:50967 length:645 start_codon:yes stop_codon:yes gene_type:complete
MKNTVFLGISMLCLSHLLNAQDFTYPKGIYMSFEEILKKEPSNSASLEIIKRSNTDIKMSGGNDYKLRSNDKLISNKDIRKDFWGYSKGDTLFINCFQYEIQQGYTPLLSDGKYLVITAGLSSNLDMQEYQLQNKKLLGAYFGPVVGGIQGAKLAMLRFIYVIDKETKTVKTVSPDYLKALLLREQDLFVAYQKEEEPENPNIIMKYLLLNNKK